ncbi:MAG: hypothetical protein CME72_11630 [Halomonadaceae bacterium]|nr:hypothetical protein [Halomonadaceae bacterium]
MNISARQHELLAEIQRLAITAGIQTQQRAVHDVRSCCNERGHYLCSDVTIRKSGEIIGNPSHETRVMICADGSDAPTEGWDERDRTLTQQRDELADWIAANRKQEAA